MLYKDNYYNIIAFWLMKNKSFAESRLKIRLSAELFSGKESIYSWKTIGRDLYTGWKIVSFIICECHLIYTWKETKNPILQCSLRLKEVIFQSAEIAWKCRNLTLKLLASHRNKVVCRLNSHICLSFPLQCTWYYCKPYLSVSLTRA